MGSPDITMCHESTDFKLDNHHLSSNDSETPESKPKIQLLELDENIHAAEKNYNSVKMQWDYVRAIRRGDVYRGEVQSRHSLVSFSSLNLISSEHSIAINHNETSDNENFEKQRKRDNQVQVVFTPRSPIEIDRDPGDDPTELQIPMDKSRESIATNKRTKKMKVKKKAPMKKTNEELCKMGNGGNAKIKRKKMRGRLKNSNSKSTVTTKETLFSSKKTDRRKIPRQKSLRKISAVHVPQSRRRKNLIKVREPRQLNTKDFVEIFKNKTLTNTTSLTAVSGRPSKIDAPEISYLGEDTSKPTIRSNENKRKFHIAEKRENKSRVIAENLDFQKESEECGKNNDRSQGYSKDENVNFYYYDPFHPRNYEMPTIASKNRQVRRPYDNRFNIRSIPFVVGTSLSPSHNLGLNIQQILNIIKMKQPTVPGISSVLIRKVSQGVRSISLLSEEITNLYAARSCQNSSFQDVNCLERSNFGIGRNVSSFSCGHLQPNFSSTRTNQSAFKQNSITCEPLYEEDEECRSITSEPRARYDEISQEKRNETKEEEKPSKSIGSRQQKYPRLCEYANKREFGLQDSTKALDGYPKNNKEMSQVCSRLYEQFDKMITQHERLMEQMEKRKDKSLMKEVADLESAMNAKEQEIKALINLHKEVVSLRRRLKPMQKRNSFASFGGPYESPPCQPRAHTALPFDSQQQEQQQQQQQQHLQQFYGFRKNNETPHSLKLVGLLRQIQAFHRQLSLA